MTPRRCCREATRWVAPTVGLALVPKCPACVAMYIATLTGAGVSMPVATGLRMAMLVACLGALAFLAARTIRRTLRRLHTVPICP